MTRLASVVGARPEFVQVGSLTRALTDPGFLDVDHQLVHTGQHYGFEMSASFFGDQLLPEPKVHLGVGSHAAASQLGVMVSKLDMALAELDPDIVIVYGDTNTTLAGGLAAAKRGIPVAHVEAGLRSFNLAMPEELNRRLTDHLARYRFCPSQTAVANLASEGVSEGVYLTGDVMHEALTHSLGRVTDQQTLLAAYDVEPRRYAVATTHRAENVDNAHRLAEILRGISGVAAQGLRVLFPVHPRTRARVGSRAIGAGVTFLPPLDHQTMVALVRNAAMLLTDSGGLQKESYWLGTPCVTMRNETEWVETVEQGWNVLAGVDGSAILDCARAMIARTPAERPPLYGEGEPTSKAILSHLVDSMSAATARAS